MPSTGGYLVSPRSIALIAACLMLSGVSKSGSPTESEITSRPLALRSRAFCVIAMVADGLTRERTSARKAIGVLAPFGWGLLEQASYSEAGAARQPLAGEGQNRFGVRYNSTRSTRSRIELVWVEFAYRQRRTAIIPPLFNPHCGFL